MIRHLGSSSSPDSVLTKKIVIQKSSGGTDSFWLWMGCGNDVGTQKWEGTVHMAVIRALTGFSVEWVQSVGYNWPIYRTHLLWYSLLTLQKSRNTGQEFRKETTTLICTGHRHVSVVSSFATPMTCSSVEQKCPAGGSLRYGLVLHLLLFATILWSCFTNQSQPEKPKQLLGMKQINRLLVITNW